MSRTENLPRTAPGYTGTPSLIFPVDPDEAESWMIYTSLDALPCGHVQIYLTFELAPGQAYYWILLVAV